MHPIDDRMKFMLKFKIAVNTLNAHDHRDELDTVSRHEPELIFDE